MTPSRRPRCRAGRPEHPRDPCREARFRRGAGRLRPLKTEGKKYRKPQTLASLAETLDPTRFLRVHRSYVINLDRLQRIDLYAKNSHVAILADGCQAPVSREGHARLRQLLDGRL